jgi:hypothetical protein
MDTPTTLIQLLLNLLSDPQAAAEFQADPQGYLATCGLTAVTPEQVHDAAALVADQHEPAKHHEPHHHTPPPPAPEPDEHHHESAVKYLQTIVTNNWIDDRDTTVDNSIHQVIHAGGDVNQTIDTNTVIASGDGAVAAGGDIADSQVVTGDDNVFGDGNVKGDGNTTAFGDGDATHADVSDVAVDHGGAFSVTGPAAGADTTDGSYNESTTSTSDSTSIDGSYNDSLHSDTSYDLDDNSTTTSDSNNHVDTDSHNDSTLVVG